MKTLLILRHAKSSWEDPTLPDHDRPLSGRGKRSAPIMGRLLADEDLVPELIVSSTARRARQTARRAADAAGYEGEIELREALYHASPTTYLDVVATLSDALDVVMVVGHNPGMEMLLTELTGAYERFPTAALAQVELPITYWHEIVDTRGRLVSLWRPRDLE